MDILLPDSKEPEQEENEFSLPLLLPGSSQFRPREIRQNAHLTRAVKPDQAAEDQKLGQASGLNTDLVSRNRDEVRSQVEGEDIQTQAHKYPGVAGYLSIKDHMAVSRDDLDKLTGVEALLKENIVDPIKSFAKGVALFTPRMGVMFENMAAMGFGALDTYAQLVADLTGTEKGGAFGRLRDAGFASSNQMEKFWLQNESLMLPEDLRGRLIDNLNYLYDPEYLVYNVLDVASSLVPIVAATVMTGGSTLVGGVLGGGMEAAGLYKDMMENGKSTPETALSASLTFGVAVGYLNKIGLEAILGKVATKNLITRIGKSIASGSVEAFTEWLEEPTQALIQTIAEGGGTEETINAVIEAAKNIEVIAGSFFAGGGISYTSQYRAEYEKIKDAERDVDFFSSLDELAADSKTRKRLPEAYEKAIAAIQKEVGGPVQDIYIDAELFQQALAEQPGLATEILEATGTTEQFEAALRTGSDLVIPLAKYATHIAGTDASSLLFKDVRFRQEGMSSREADQARTEWAETMQEQLDALKADNVAETAFEQERQRVYEDVLQRRKAVGRVSKTSKEDASVWAAFAATWATRYGGTPWQAYEQMAPEVVADKWNAQNVAQRQQPLLQVAEGDPILGIATEVNTVLPGHDVSYDGQQDLTPLGRPPLYQFTARSGPAKGATFLVAEPTKEAVTAKLAEVVQRFELLQTDEIEGMTDWLYYAAGVDKVFTIRAKTKAAAANKIKKAFGVDSIHESRLLEKGTSLRSERVMLYQDDPPRTAGGGYKGAPPSVTSPQSLGALRRLIAKFAREGSPARYWYEDSAQAIMKITKGDVVEAEKFIQLLAIYSANQAVFPNMILSLRAYNYWKNGGSRKNFHVATGIQDTKAVNLLYDGSVWEGVKTQNFYVNLMHDIIVNASPEDLAKLGLTPAEVEGRAVPVTVDVWMMRAFGYPAKTTSGDQGGGAYSFVENETKRLTEIANQQLSPGEEPWTAHQMQAAIWSGLRTRFNDPAVKAATIKESVRKGYSHYEDVKNKLKWKSPTKVADKKAHNAVWRKHALKLESDYVAGIVSNSPLGSFGDASRRMTESITWEAVPSPDLNHDMLGASNAVQREFNRQAQQLLLDEDGNDLLAAQLGVPFNWGVFGVGGYDGGVHPNLITSLLPGKGRGPFSRKEVEAYARAIQFIYKQNSVPWFRIDRQIKFKGDYKVFKQYEKDGKTWRGKIPLRKFNTLEEATEYADSKEYATEVEGSSFSRGVQFTFESKLTEEAEESFFTKLREAFGEEAGFTRVSDTEIVMINYRNGKGIPFMMYDTEFITVARKFSEDNAVELNISGVEDFGVEGEYGHVQDWKADAKGDTVLDQAGLKGQHALQAWLRDRRKAFEGLLTEYSGEALKQRETEVEQATELFQAGQRLTSPPVEDNGTVELTHWSQTPGIDMLNPEFFGTAHAGKERKRQQSDPDNFINRTYYGIGVGKPGGYVKERELGTHRYTASIPMERLYDFQHDPEGIYAATAEDHVKDPFINRLSLYEKRLKEAGYAGYWTDSPMGLTAALFEEAATTSYNEDTLYQASAWHGSPYSGPAEGFSTENIGTGEGAAAFGWGLYFTELKGIAEHYAKVLTRRNLGRVDPIENGTRISIGSINYEKYKAEDEANQSDYAKVTLSVVFDNASVYVVQGGSFKWFVDQTKRDLAKVDREIESLEIAGKYVGYGLLVERKIYADVVEEATPDNIRVELPEAKNRHLFKVTLHKGKEPSEYTWLDWYETVSQDIKEKVLGPEQVAEVAALRKWWEEKTGENWDNITVDHKDRQADLYINATGKDVSLFAIKVLGKYRLTGIDLYRMLIGRLGSKKAASLFLLEQGVDGVRYPVESLGGKGRADKPFAIKVSINGESQEFSIDIINQIKQVFNAPGSLVKDQNKKKQLLRTRLMSLISASTGPGAKDTRFVKSVDFIGAAGEIVDAIDSGTFELTQAAQPQNFVVFDDKAVTVEEHIAFQSTPADPRGSFTMRDGRPLIKMFETANASTFLHESGHAFMNFMGRMASQPNAPEALVKDWKILTDYVADEDTYAGKQEKMARALESYFLEGKAPSAELRGVFQQFAAWLKAIYHQAQNLNVDISDEVRGVFDRLLATDKDIEQARMYHDAQKPYFDAAAEISAAERKRYDELRRKAEVSAKDQRLQKYTKAYFQALGGKKGLRAEAAEEVEAMREYRAIEFMVEQGGVSADILDFTVGVDARKRLQEQHKGVVVKGGTAQVNEVLSTYGFKSAADLVTTLTEAPTKVKKIKQVADQHIDEAYAAIDRGLREGPAGDGEYHSNAQLAVLAAEVQMLQRKQAKKNPRVIESSVVRSVAWQILQDKPIKDAQGHFRYSQAEAKAAKAARKALKAGDLQAAEKYKRQEMLNHALVLEAIKIREEATQIAKRFDRALKRKSVDHKYMAQVAQFLMKYGFTKRVIKLPEGTKSFEAFTDAVQANELSNPSSNSVPEWADWTFNDSKVGVPWTQAFNMTELREADEIVTWLLETGVDLEKGRLASYEESLQEIKDQCLVPANKLKNKQVLPKTHFLRRISDQTRAYFADHDMLLFILDKMDGFTALTRKGFESFGPNRLLLGHKLAAAQDARDFKRRELFLRLKPAIDQLVSSAKKFDKIIDSVVPVPALLQRDGRSWDFNKIVAVALNMGNATNIQRVVDGYEIVTERELMEAVGDLEGMTQKKARQRLLDVKTQIGRDRLKTLTSILTKEDWGAIQEIWDTVNSYWPELKAEHFKIHHFHREKVEAEAFVMTTADGETVTLRGGYYPLKYDPSLSKRIAGWNETDLMLSDSIWGHPNVKNGMVQARVQRVVLPVDLSLNVMFRHLEDTIHYITHAAIIRDIDRITQDQEYQQVMEDKLGRSVYATMRPALRAIARPERSMGLQLDHFIDKMRVLSTAYILGLNTSVAVKQLFSLPGVWHDIGLMNYAKGVAQVAGGPLESYHAMHDASIYMATRSKSFDREIRDSGAAIMRKGFAGMNPGWRDKLRDVAFLPIRLMDFIAVYPSWNGAFKAEMKRSHDPEKAVRYADEMVRASQPSAKPLDLSKVQFSKNTITRLFSMFMTFTIKYGNRQRYFYRAWREGSINFAEYTHHVALEAIAPPLAMNLMFAAMWGDDPDPVAALLDVFSYQFAGLVMVRDVMGVMSASLKNKMAEKKAFVGSIGESPAFTGFEVAQRAWTALLNIAEDLGDDETLEKAVWAFAELISFKVGIPVPKLVGKLMEGMRQFEEDEGTIFNALVPNPAKKER